ncbi:unnamed protein product, partial [Urochloa humidicola]
GAAVRRRRQGAHPDFLTLLPRRLRRAGQGRTSTRTGPGRLSRRRIPTTSSSASSRARSCRLGYLTCRRYLLDVLLPLSLPRLRRRWRGATSCWRRFTRSGARRRVLLGATSNATGQDSRGRAELMLGVSSSPIPQAPAVSREEAASICRQSCTGVKMCGAMLAFLGGGFFHQVRPLPSLFSRLPQFSH